MAGFSPSVCIIIIIALRPPHTWKTSSFTPVSGSFIYSTSKKSAQGLVKGKGHGKTKKVSLVADWGRIPWIQDRTWAAKTTREESGGSPIVPTAKNKIKTSKCLLGSCKLLLPFCPLFFLYGSTPLKKVENGERREFPRGKCVQATQGPLTCFIILQKPKLDRPLLVHTDTSKKGIGVVLSQKFDGEEHLIPYVALQWMARTKDTNPQITRWVISLSCFLWFTEPERNMETQMDCQENMWYSRRQV